MASPHAPSAGSTVAVARSRRDPVYDLIKAIGLLGIVVAHTHPPGWLFQLRNFGVPTMALVAGGVFVLSQERRPVALLPYLRKRVVQLLVPVWVFLGFAFVALSVVAALTDGHHYRFASFQRSMLLDGTIANTWVIRVFLLLSLLGPFWLWLVRRGTDLRKRLWLLGWVALAYQVAVLLWNQIDRGQPPFVRTAVEEYAFFGIGFGIFFALGISLREIPLRRQAAIAAGLGLGLLAFFVARGEFVQTQRWKYPPEFPYLAYAGMCGLGLHVALRRSATAARIGATRLVRMVSTASLWTYLWHGFYLEVWDRATDSTAFVPELAVNVALALATVAVQERAVARVLDRPLQPRTRWWVATVFAAR